MRNSSFQIPANDADTIVKITVYGRADALAVMLVEFCLRQMHDDLERCAMGQFARPANDELFCILVEVALRKWIWVESVEKLRNIADAQFDSVADCRSEALFHRYLRPSIARL